MAYGFLGVYFKGDWRKNGKEVYREHVQSIRSLGLSDDKLLEWNVEEGWEPLCAFLDKKVPEEDFPNGNTPATFEKRIDEMMKQRTMKAALNMVLTLGALFALGIGGWYAHQKR